jgi:hypothetical protein
MSQKSTNKKNAASAGMKALIATASVAATIAGWALLPANDPSAFAGTAGQANQQQAITVPNGDDFSQAPDTNQTIPSSPDSQLPQVQAPRGSSRIPFTSTHSSR